MKVSFCPRPKFRGTNFRKACIITSLLHVSFMIIILQVKRIDAGDLRKVDGICSMAADLKEKNIYGKSIPSAGIDCTTVDRVQQ